MNEPEYIIEAQKRRFPSMMKEAERLEDETIRMEKKDVIEILKTLECLKRKLQPLLK
jgi:hypothetical protein